MLDASLSDAALSEYAEATRVAAAEYGLELHSTFTGLASYSSNGLLHPQASMRAACQKWFERAIAFTSMIGARGTGGFIGSLTAHDATDATRRASLLEDLANQMRMLSQVASEKRLAFLMFENMSGFREFGHTIEEAHLLERIAAGSPVPWLLCLDVGHTVVRSGKAEGGSPEEWLGEQWFHTPVLQLQQANREGDQHWPFTRARNQAGLVLGSDVVEAIGGWPEEDDVCAFLEIMHPPEADDEAVLADLRESVAYWTDQGMEP
jgi:hypothetical protein